MDQKSPLAPVFIAIELKIDNFYFIFHRNDQSSNIKWESWVSDSFQVESRLVTRDTIWQVCGMWKTLPYYSNMLQGYWYIQFMKALP